MTSGPDSSVSASGEKHDRPGGSVRPGIQNTCAAILIPIVLLFTTPFEAQGQSKPTLVVAEQILMLPRATVPLPIQVDASTDLPPNTFLRLRNVPPGAKLTEGYRVSEGTWAVPLDRLIKLRIRYPDEITREARVSIQLVSLDGSVHAERKIMLLAAPKPISPPRLVSRDQKRASEVRQRANDVMSATANLAVGDKPATATPNPSTQAPSRTIDPDAARFLAKGNQFLLLGNIATARLFYRRAADKGLAAAAMALAASYDPGELEKLGIVGTPGDIPQAREWYERAAKLGAPQAAERIANLPAQ